jgi:hypothetical protein
MHLRTRRLLTLLLLVALALGAAACGDDDGETSTGSDPDTPVVSEPGDGSDLGDVGAEPVPGSGWNRIEPAPALVNANPAFIDELTPDPADPSVLLVRLFGGIQECYGAQVDVTETDTEVSVALFTGGRENIPAGIACIEIAEAQEIAVTLAAPVGERSVVAVSPAGDGGGVGGEVPEPVDPGANLAQDPALWIGLTTDEAVAQAEGEGPEWRIAMEDGEVFALTEDFQPDRVNFEIESGTLTGVWFG